MFHVVPGFANKKFDLDQNVELYGHICDFRPLRVTFCKNQMIWGQHLLDFAKNEFFEG